MADAAQARFVDPDETVLGPIGAGRVVPDNILSTADLPIELTEDQRIRLGREELASWLEMGARFEAALNTALSMLILQTNDLTRANVRFLLHEIGEETRHQRAFIRVIDQIGPQARNPLRPRWAKPVERLALPQLVGFPALLHVLIMAGEEVPDVYQKHTAAHPDTDPVVAAVNRYHRMEEARHLGYVRTVFPDIWASAGPTDRALVRRVAPQILRSIGMVLVHPGVYATVGLPTWQTWYECNRSPSRHRMLIEAYRPILRMLIDADAFPNDVPRGWRRLCAVTRQGTHADIATS